MKRFAAIVFGVFALAVIYGCSNNAPPTETGDDSSNATAAATNTLLPNTPERAVEQFLSVLRTGDKAAAMKLMTSEAQVACQTHGLNLDPPGSPNAVFKIGSRELDEVIEHPSREQQIDGEDAQVFCTWEDVDEAGVRQTYAIVWLLGQEPSGWAIMGMATKVFPDTPALVLNFEDPDELLLRREQVRQELVRRANSVQQRMAAEDGTLQR